MEPDNSDDEQQCGKEQSFFEEAAELDSLVQRVAQSEGNESTRIYDRYKAILYKYQEQSQLLDTYLEGIVVPLASLLRKQAIQQLDQGLQRVLGTCRLLNVLVVVRGYKTVVRFYPHEAADLERVVDILEAVRVQRPKDNEEGIALWEAQTMLLLWLSILILIPFDLATVDSSAVGGEEATAATTSAPYTPLVGRILSLCKEYLHHPGGVREMAAVVLGRLLTRPDMGPAMSEFLEWCPVALAEVDPLRQPFLLPGIMQALCCAFKVGQRDRLLPFASRAWALAQSLASNPTYGSEKNVLARQLTVKLVTRIGLTFLKPRLAPWRYVRGGASLDVTLGAEGGSLAAPITGGGADGGAAADGAEGEGGEEEEEEVEIVEELEEVVDRLLQSLRDKDTVVRWSAAKGVGRVTGCLPRELGDEVVESVMQLFGPTEEDRAWHGGCLALAELARRGLLLPDRLPPLMPIISAALHYDVRRGPHSIGAHVRDAAAYVCWAFARAYDPELLEDSVTLLASSLLTIACYDREVNCRRAAAAAFQESVGRLGNFPHGIELLTVADYFSVGIAQQAYLEVAPQVAARAPEYRQALASHLVAVKARHWEKALRELAARAAAALVPYHASYFSGPALDELLPACLNDQLEVRHGAVVMVAELLPALASAAATSPSSPSPPSSSPPPCWPLRPEREAAVAALVPSIDKARLYRGKGGEVMREAVCRLVEGCAAVALDLSAGQHAKVLEALDENLRHPQAYIQTGAVAAVRAYAKAYLSTDPRAAAAFRARYQDGYLTRLHDANVAVRRGYSLALGSLPAQLLRPVLDDAVDALLDGCVPEEDLDERDVESRVNCTRALGLLIETMFAARASADGAVGPGQEAAEALRDKILPSLRASLEDYTTDNRGDVGSWVREAAMGVMAAAVPLLARCYVTEGGDGGGPSLESEQGRELAAIAGSSVGLLLRQSVERIGRVRESALRHVRALVSDPDLAPYIPGTARLATAASAAAEAAEAGGVTASLEALQRIVVQLLGEASYTEPLLEGLVASIGGVDNSLSKVASQALLEALAAGGEGGRPAMLTAVAGRLLDVWSLHPKSPRLATPLLRTALLLLTKAADVAEVRLPRPPPSQAAAEPSPPSPPSSSRFVDHLVEAVRGETRGCSDVARLVEAGSVLCHLVPYAGHCRTSALQGLMVLLSSRFPKVRRNAAEQLYLQLIALDAPTPTITAGSAAPAASIGEDSAAAAAPTPLEQVAEAAADLLLMTVWDGELEAAKAARDELAAVIGVSVPKMKAPAAGAAGGRAAGAARDENASYQALLDDFARGY